MANDLDVQPLGNLLILKCFSGQAVDQIDPLLMQVGKDRADGGFIQIVKPRDRPFPQRQPDLVDFERLLAFAGVTVSITEWQYYQRSPSQGLLRFGLLASFTVVLFIFCLYSFLKARSVR